ncbi:MAG: SusC/RagA family TonB-linked outer membrane protein [Lewinellaceae bacterium]|nr:SusC/RagA family TonB-linked outer membrane protein [Saprospiraceae bacterium]MCB9331565.1 SusC/RagA family TonB-linked outer membrane protein [Lewinellaceae bacterium]
MKQLLCLLALAWLSALPALAQRAISGKVTNTDGEALAGVTVISPGQAGGTSTNEAGIYQISVPGDAGVLRFTYTGYQTIELALGTSSEYNPVLQPNTNTLQELVVVGYGTQQKRDITGNIATVNGDDLPDIPAQSFDQLLQGRATGVNVSLPNGVLNNPPVFRIRGINSISLSSYPLIVIDGMPSFTGDISSPLPAFNFTAHNVLSGLNPADIESIDILKDASAAAIYGSRASSGVVLITTKNGHEGSARVNYDAWVGWSQPARLPNMLNAQQYVKIKNEGAHNAGLPDQFFLDSINGQLIDTRWFDHIYRTGFSHNQNLSFSGGGARTKYYISLEYTEQEGIIRKNNFERLGGRFNLSHRFGERFRVGTNMAYSNIENQSTGTGSVPGQSFYWYGMGRLAMTSPPNVGPYLTNGDYNGGWPLGSGKNLQSFIYPNAVALLDRDRFVNQARQLQASVFAELEPWKGLLLKSQYSRMDIGSDDEFYNSPLNDDFGYIYKSLLKNRRWNWQNTAGYDFNIANRHAFNVLAGNEQQYSEVNYFGADRYGAADPFFATFGGNYLGNTVYGQDSRNFLYSWFGRVSYAFDQKYLLTANLRQDEYSAFAPGHRTGTFWGISGGWILSEEAFWEGAVGEWVNYFKLRGSYGEVGNNSVGDYAALSLFGSGIYGDNATFYFSQAGNPNLSWETSKKTDIGFQFGLLNDRLQGEYTWFKSLIDGLLLQAPQPPSLGIPNNAIAANIGSMQNTGHEFGLSGVILQKRMFSWRSTVNLTFMRNEVLELSAGNEDIFGYTADFELANITRVGESAGSIFAIPTQGVNPENGRRIFVKADGTLVQYQHLDDEPWTLVSNGLPTSAPSILTDGRVYGPALPKWFGGWNNVFQYGNLDLNLEFNFAGGNYVYNGSKAGLRDQRWWNNHTDVLDRWSESNTSGSIPRLVYGDNVSNGSALPISENVEKADFLRLRNIMLGYQLPAALLSRAHITGLRIYVNVNNAWLLTSYSGTDPEVSTNGNSNQAPNVDRNTAPMARSYTIGLNLNL